jgi:flagellar FliL protein
MSKAPAKPAEGDAAPKKSKKMLIIIIAVVVLLAGGGGAAFVLMKPHPPKDGEEAAHVEEAHATSEPKYMELGTYTANLIHEEGDRYLQVAISLKVTKPELEEKIKKANPEIQHRVNMLLQSKRPSELATLQGKNALADQVKGQVEYILGLRKDAPVIAETNTETAPAEEHATPPAEAHEPAAENAATADGHGEASDTGIAEVLFTSFIVQ